MRTQIYFSWEGATAWGWSMVPMRKLNQRNVQQKGPRFSGLSISCGPSRARKALINRHTARYSTLPTTAFSAHHSA